MQTCALKMGRQKGTGFTLIELMVVVLVIGILAAVALPSYNRQVQKSRRTDAHNILMRVAGEQERHYTTFNRYAGDLSAAPPAGLGFASLDSEHGHYVISVAAGAGNQTYTLTATPQGSQSADTCGSLTLGNSDAKGFSGNEDNGVCW